MLIPRRNPTLAVKMWRCFANLSSHPNHQHHHVKKLMVLGQEFETDSFTNISSHILLHLERNLHLQEKHPLNILKQRIVKYLQSKYVNGTGSPKFSEYSRLNPVVSLTENFDNLLVPQDHPSRKLTDSYYINKEYMLRAHMTAHDSNLIRSGLDNFVLIGDVYRRDEIDRNHYPVFHQVDAVRLRTENEVFNKLEIKRLSLFDGSPRDEMKQEGYTLEAVKLMEFELKTCIIGLVEHLFGKGVKYRWDNSFFPFTHPSWELEIEYNNEWLEVIGCGILEQKILEKAGAGYKIGWAFGLGLERIAMKLFNIPDIRLFWSRDSGFLSQFDVEDINQKIIFKPVSVHPQCVQDISFWISESFQENNFFELIRNVGGDLVEQIKLVDKYTHPKSQETSHCYRITYRHLERPLTNDEVNKIHNEIGKRAANDLNVKVR